MLKTSFHSLARIAIATLGVVAATHVSAQQYGFYVDHEVDLDTPLAAAGNVTNNSWVNLSSVTKNGVAGNVGYSSFPGTSPWPRAIASQVNSAGSDAASLTRVSNGTGGGAFAAGGSLYFGGFLTTPNVNGGTLRVTDSTPIANLQTVVFQLGFGEAMTYDFYNDALPTLSYTTAAGTVTAVAATFSQKLEQFANGTVSMPTGEEPIYINQYGLQWDLSGVTQPITSFSIDFNGVQHSQLYGLTLTQSDVFTQVVAVPVPEPETYALMLAGLATVGAIARRRKAQA